MRSSVPVSLLFSNITLQPGKLSLTYKLESGSRLTLDKKAGRRIS